MFIQLFSKNIDPTFYDKIWSTFFLKYIVIFLKKYYNIVVIYYH
jgi:hypothetical protein